MINTYENFEVEDLGVQEEWVYDIEVEDNHNFFGNNILLHNSIYYHIEPFVEMYKDKNPGVLLEDQVTWADNFEQKIIQPVVSKCIEDFSKELNAYDSGAIGAEREIISDAAVFTAKKKYYARVRDSEGTVYPIDDPYIKVMGLEIAKSSTPPWAKKYLKLAIPHILDKDDTELREWIRTIKEEYITVPINDISMSSTISTVVYNPLDLDKNGKPKAMTQGTKSASAYNNYLNDNNLVAQYNEIQPGEKCKRVYLTTPNPANSTEIISFLDGAFIEKELIDYVDYDRCFQKYFLSPLEIMTNALKWDLEKETADISDW